MSVRRAFKLAVVEYLTETAGLDKGMVGIVGPEGRPPPTCGDFYIGVWGGGRQQGIKTAVDLTVTCSITVTKRLSQPFDRWDAALDAEADGIDEQVDRLVSLLMAGQNLIRARTAELMHDGVDGTSEAPRVLTDTEPRPVDASWFQADPGPGKGAGQIYGFACTLQYGGLRVTHPWDTSDL